MNGKTMACAMTGILFSTFGGSAAEPRSGQKVITESARVLVACYSWSGHTERIADAIAERTGGTRFTIRPEKPYSTDYATCLEQSKRDLAAKTRPALSEKVPNFNRYDVIFVGGPNWYGTMAPPMAAFLTSCDFKGKTVIPFFTNGGGGMQNCERDARKLCPGVRMLPAITFTGASSQGLDEWLSRVIEIRGAASKPAAPARP